MAVFYRYIMCFSLAYLVKKSYICTKKSGNSSRLGQILEIMLFSKAIQIKAMVNRFNQERSREGFPAIVFHCEMFSLGKWAIDLEIDGNGVFFSDEVSPLTSLLAFGGLKLFVGSNSLSPVFHFQ